MSALDLLIVILILGWAGGLGFHVAGSLIHLLLLIALVTLVFRIVSGRRV